jgi:hypothetical protein
VRRAPDPKDARSYRIELTQAGQAAHDRAAELFAPVLAEVEAALKVPIAHALSVLSAIDVAVRTTNLDQ